jgi:fatty-acyl-CoA synthase
MSRFADRAQRDQIEQTEAWPPAGFPATPMALLASIAARHPDRPALSFQLLSAPDARASTLTWAALLGRVRQAAALFRSLGIGPDDTVAMVLPNCPEAVLTLLGAMTAGRVAPINPLLEPAQIAAILRLSRARVVVSLRAFPRSDIAQKVAAALAEAPDVAHLLEVDLAPHLGPPKAWLIPLLRPANRATHAAKVQGFDRALASAPAWPLPDDGADDGRIRALFHTGGTTGLPRLVGHRAKGLAYNGWLGARLLLDQSDVVLCPLPLFHVFAAYPILMSAMASGAHVVLPTPAGYRGEGVMDNFWHLIARWRATFLITVPTAIAALVQRPVNADVSSLRCAISGSAALSRDLAARFEAATGVQIAEGYGLTEATCLVSCNPVEGLRKIGSAGLPLPHTRVAILRPVEGGWQPCGVDEVGEICVRNPGVLPDGPYVEASRNDGLVVAGGYLRTGDLGRLDADGYLWITGRLKDVIIRGGHNIDPGVIEEALMTHPAVALAAAVGQPDPVTGELPCAFVELVPGADASAEAILDHATPRIPERAAIPKHLEILPEIPRTGVGKIYKPALRKRATERVLRAHLDAAGCANVRVTVREDRAAGLVAVLGLDGATADPAALAAAATAEMDRFAIPWVWEGRAGA